MKTKEKKTMKYVVLIGLLIIPFMYSFFYLKAFWDPYGQMDDIPVALVNLDTNGDKAKELTEKLISKKALKLKLVTTDIANEGLQNNDYYAIITIPENFTDNLNNIANKDRQITTITYSPNQKSNYLASQIINRVVSETSKSLTSQINGEVVSTLTNKLNEVPNQISKIENGLTTLENGTTTLVDGSKDLTSGALNLTNGVSTIDNGITSALAGNKSLVNGSLELKNGSTNLVNGVNTYIDTVNDSVNKVANSMTTLKQAMVIINQLNAGLQNPNLDQATKNNLQIQLNQVLNKVNQSLNDINIADQVSTLNSAGGSIKTGLNNLDLGIDKIYQGTVNLNNGLEALSAGSTKLVIGSKDLQSGSTKLNQGLLTLKDGITQAKTEVNNSTKQMNRELTKLDGLSDYVKEPVQLVEKDTPKVNEYGTAFAPYFISISLWIGALMLFVVLYYDVLDRFTVFSRNSKNTIKRTGMYMLMAVIQAIILGVLLKFGLGFTVTNYALYFGVLTLTSLAFILIMEFLIVNFGDVGKFLAILFLVLQLASSAGTFPIETVPSFFKAISPFMPMSYTINLFKESLISINSDLLVQNILVISGIVILFIIINIVRDLYINKKEKRIS